MGQYVLTSVRWLSCSTTRHKPVIVAAVGLLPERRWERCGSGGHTRLAPSVHVMFLLVDKGSRGSLGLDDRIQVR
jgi:hypothetical protein